MKRFILLPLGFAVTCMALPAVAADNVPQPPTLTFAKLAAQKFLDDNNVCAVVDLSGDYRRAGEWANGVSFDRARAFAPFVRAGLLTFQPSGSGRARFELTPLGQQHLTKCLIDADAYPMVQVDGFRIGRRIISTVDRHFRMPTKIDCRWLWQLKVFYKVKIEVSWYKEMEFTTNLSTYAQDEHGRHYAIAKFTTSGVDNSWYLDPSVGDVHAMPVCISSVSEPPH